MKAAVFAKQGLELREVSQPQPKEGEVLVRVRYAGLNRVI
jgi:NADPH:quinone reductase-like Zn-dependent oxidoreductase